MTKSFNVVVFRKVENTINSGFSVEHYATWRKVNKAGLSRMFSYLDTHANDWWYVNVYERHKDKSTTYAGRIYTDTRRTDF